jgi:hypothetical protein
MLEVLDDKVNEKLHLGFEFGDLVMKYCENGEIAKWNYEKEVF